MKDINLLSKEIKDYFNSIDDNFERPKITIDFDQKQKTCTVHISKMYHGLGKLISFQALNWLSQQLGTEKINLENENYRGGCESCDYGSEHSIDIECFDIEI